ncbi:MAG: hypothetical protein OEY95_03210 [Candidatus Bathyarchaeota archaeon]|nr:hypothetical protein [Candidatus Bathyarchaeota archaeon]
MKVSKFKLAFIVLTIATIIWTIVFYNLQEYFIFLFYAWGVFIWLFLSEKLLERKKTRHEMSKAIYRFVSRLRRLTYNVFYGSVLHYFKSVNRKVRSKLAFWYMKCETLQHVDLLIRVFKWVVLPASLFYVCADFYFFGQNALDSMFLGILIFFYSNFLPDLPSIFRRKTYHDIRDTTEDLSWYKKYALLLFAPLFIGAFFSGMRLRWKTTETFHNFKSLIIYGAFLFTLSFFAFGDFPISTGDITEILSLPFYGLIGYLTHLKVDLCF